MTAFATGAPKVEWPLDAQRGIRPGSKLVTGSPLVAARSVDVDKAETDGR